MLVLPPDLASRYATWMARHDVAVEHRPHYNKWLRYYWDFCQKYAREPTERQSFPAFREKLRSKKQSDSQCQQASAAVSLYYEMVLLERGKGRRQPAEAVALTGVEVKSAPQGARASSPSIPSPAAKAVTRSPTSPPLTLQKAEAAGSPPRSPQPPNTLTQRDRKADGFRSDHNAGLFRCFLQIARGMHQD
jgi:hypothetical protein